MGKSYSTEKKTEDIVIAQNGANDATNSHFTQKIDMVISIGAIVIVLVILYVMHKKCMHRIRKVVKQEISAGRTDNVQQIQQQALPRQMV